MTTPPTAPLHYKGSFTDLLTACESITAQDFTDALKHIAAVAAQNNDETALAMLQLMLTDTEHPAGPALARMLHEALAVGKELTLRKLCRHIDPHGEWFDVPDEWIGKGPGA